jgi:flagellar biosynthesis/type III secretory pathway protein FliH
MMMTLFDEEYNLKMYEKDIFNQGISQGMSQGISQGISQGMSQGISQGINQGLVATINMCREQFGKTVDETIQAIKEAYHLSQSEAESIVKENWK